MESRSEAAQAEELTPEIRRELTHARRCFTGMERLTTLMLSYPPGHPIVEEAAENLSGAFREFFELNDRLSVMVDAHSLKFLGTEERVWQTEDPRDYCWALSRDGIYLLHFLAGVNNAELRYFVEIINTLVDERDMTTNSVMLLFEAGFRFISYDAIDESMAALAGLEMDIRNRDTKEEQEAIEELFEDVFDKEKQEEMSPQEAARKHQEEFQVRMERRADRQQRMDMGSRQFLMLSDAQQDHLRDLKRGFTEHAELEHREGEILAAILGARPKPGLRDQSIDQISEVMGTLLETQRPWESLEFLKLIHEWRENFDEAITAGLKNVVVDCFTTRRLSQMIKMVATADARVRRAILQMFNALHLQSASEELVRLLDWDVEDEVEKDVLRFLQERSRYGVGFLANAITEVSSERAKPLMEIAVRRMPQSKSMMLKLITGPCEPELKHRAVQAMNGHWESAQEATTHLEPLLDSSSDSIRLAALRGLADVAPEDVLNMIEPQFKPDLAKRPEAEVREMANIYLTHGGERAMSNMQELIQRRGMIVSEDERDLAILLAKMIARTPLPGVAELLEEVAGDWRVSGKIRSTCKELAALLRR